MVKLTRKTLGKSFHHWYYGNLTCFSQEHMQTFGYLASMLPVVEELYKDKEEQAKAMQTYTAFFNTEPQLGALIVGITAGLEEARANGADGVDDETINGLRAGLMGPVAGIGDSLIVGTLIPIILGIALGLSNGGSPLCGNFFIFVWDFICFCAKDVIVFVTDHNRGGKEFFIEGGCHSDFLQFDESLFDNTCFLVEICLVFHFVGRIAADNHIVVRRAFIFDALVGFSGVDGFEQGFGCIVFAEELELVDGNMSLGVNLVLNGCRAVGGCDFPVFAAVGIVDDVYFDVADTEVV